MMNDGNVKCKASSLSEMDEAHEYDSRNTDYDATKNVNLTFA